MFCHSEQSEESKCRGLLISDENDELKKQKNVQNTYNFIGNLIL